MTPGLAARVDHRAAEQAGAPALIWGDVTLGYDELRRMVDRHQEELSRHGVAAGRPVAVPAETIPDVIAAVLACQRLGAPVLLPSAELPPTVLDELARQAGCGHRLRPAGGGLEVRRLPTEGPPPDGADGATFLLTTSGTTGVPKIVPIGTGSFGRFADWAGARFGITAGARVLSYAPLNFDLSLLDVWTTLAHGGCVVLTERGSAANGRYLADLVVATRPELIQAVPMFYQLVLAGRPDGSPPVESVRHLLYSGDSAPARLLARLPEMFPRARIGNLYGCTEINDAFLHEIDPAAGPAPDPMPLGEALPGVDWLLVGPDGGRIDGAGTGELWVRTPYQSTGYLDVRLSGPRFAPWPPGSPTAPYFRSGDVVRRTAGGALYLEGRRDFQVKVRGTQVNLQSVERALLEHPDIAEAAVVALADDLAGHRLHAVVRGTGPELNGLTVRRHCSTRLSRIAIPSSVTIVDLPLPRTSTGKIDRAGVRQAILDGTW
jgi:acyl-coenzyme A synthetase/AMP-(fatty) acid ligase